MGVAIVDGAQVLVVGGKPSPSQVTATTNTPLTGYLHGDGSTVGTGSESANTVFAGPATGSAAAPAFRALVPADISSSIMALVYAIKFS